MARFLEAMNVNHLVGLGAASGVVYSWQVNAKRDQERIAASKFPDVQSVAPGFNMDKYTGRWYEIGSTKTFIQQPKTLVSTTSTYEKQADGSTAMNNSGKLIFSWGPIMSASAVARPADPAEPAKMTVQYSFLGGAFQPKADYWVLNAGHSNSNDSGSSRPYDYAIVGNGNARSKCWILSRSPSMPDELYAQLQAELLERGYDLSARAGYSRTEQLGADADASISGKEGR